MQMAGTPSDLHLNGKRRRPPSDGKRSDLHLNGGRSSPLSDGTRSFSPLDGKRSDLHLNGVRSSPPPVNGKRSRAALEEDLEATSLSQGLTQQKLAVEKQRLAHEARQRDLHEDYESEMDVDDEAHNAEPSGSATAMHNLDRGSTLQMEDEVQPPDEFADPEAWAQSTQNQDLKQVRGEAEELKTVKLLMAQGQFAWSSVAQSILHDAPPSSDEDHDHIDNTTLMASFRRFYMCFCELLVSRTDVIERAAAIYGDNVATLKQLRHQYVKVFGSFHIAITRRELDDERTPAGRELGMRLKRLAAQIKYLAEVSASTFCALNYDDEGVLQFMNDACPTVMFHEPNLKDLTPKACMDEFIQSLAHRENLRKKNGIVYKPRYNDDGKFVYCYEEVSDMSTFVFNSVFPISHYRWWYNQLLQCKLKDLIDHLTHVRSERFPELVTDPLSVVFQNGMFWLRDGNFYWLERDEDHPEHKLMADIEGGPPIGHIYHDLYFDEDAMLKEAGGDLESGFYKVQCEPLFDICETQQLQPLPILWIMGMLGRLLFPLGLFENWGVFILFLGLAGTGKSTLLRWVASILDRRDVGYLGNKGRENFGLQELLDKRLWMALDIDGHWNIDVATWLSMAVGEEVVISVMYKGSVTVKWQSPGAAAANEPPDWQDKGGNVERRLFVVEFLYFVMNANPNLFKSCQEHIPRFLALIVWSYRYLVSQYSDNILKNVMPKPFKESLHKTILRMNPLEGFVRDCCEVDGHQTDPTVARYRLTINNFNLAFMNWSKAVETVKRKPPKEQDLNGVRGKYGLDVVDGNADDNETDPEFRQRYMRGIRLKQSAYMFLQKE